MGINIVHFPLKSGQSGGGDKIPGWLVTNAPRSAQRHRRDDVVAMWLQISGNHRYSCEQIDALVREAARQFYLIQGSVTRAMHAVGDWLNKQIMERNLNEAHEGVQTRGDLCLAVVHAGWLFIGQLGNSALIKISPERIDAFNNPAEPSECLGQVKRIQMRFSQSSLAAGDIVMLCGIRPDAWSATNLSGSNSLTPAALRRRLLSQVPKDFHAGVIRCVDGNGRVMDGSWADEESLSARDNADESVGQPLPVPQVAESQPAPGKEATPDPYPLRMQDSRTESRMASSKDEDVASMDDELDQGEDQIQVLEGETEHSKSADMQVARKNSESAVSPALVAMARAWMNAKTLFARARLTYGKLRPGFIKQRAAGFSSGMPLLSLLVAVILPVGLVAVSVSVYTRTGRQEQYQRYFQQAQKAFALAEVEKEPLQQHGYWAQTVQLVTHAEEFHITRESRLLFEQAQILMDEMDLATRLDFRPALTAFLPEGVMVSRIRSSFTGLYLLDQTSGSVLRLYLNTNGFYDIDQEFNCAPGPYGLVIVTKLIDFITLPANEDNHRVMGIDEQGNLLYCRSDAPPVSITLTPPENGWGRIAAIGYDHDILYVLDAQNSAIWMYAGKNPQRLNVPGATGIFFAASPVSFLDEEIPDLSGGVDMVINQQELYVLHEDGHMTLCRYSPIKEVRLTECQDPAPYTDNRIGRDNKKPWIFMDAQFTRMQDIKVPTLAIFVLDVSQPSIYQFSFQLNLERTLRIQHNRNYPLPDTPPSGFGLTPDMEIILVFENRLYLAPLR